MVRGPARWGAPAGVLAGLALLLACGGSPEADADARAEAMDARARLEAARARFQAAPTAPALREALPAFLPVPDRYIVLSDVEAGPVRVVALEVTEDPRALVARFNEALEGVGREVGPLSPVEGPESEGAPDGLLTAMGFVRGEFRGTEVEVRITVAEYEEGGALEVGGRGAVSYRIGPVPR